MAYCYRNLKPTFCTNMHFNNLKINKRVIRYKNLIHQIKGEINGVFCTLIIENNKEKYLLEKIKFIIKASVLVLQL